MTGKLMEYASHSLLWAGFACVLFALGIMLWRDSMPLRDADLRKIISDLKEKSKGWVRVPAFMIVLPFLIIMLASSLVPTLYPYAEPHPLVPSYDWYFVQVPWEMPDQEYWVRTKDGREAKITFCKSFKPPFNEGEYLESIEFRNYVGCIFPEHYIGAHVPDNPSVHAVFNCPSLGKKSTTPVDPHCNMPKEVANGN